jgi:hypothetical protein
LTRVEIQLNTRGTGWIELNCTSANNDRITK